MDSEQTTLDTQKQKFYHQQVTERQKGGKGKRKHLNVHK